MDSLYIVALELWGVRVTIIICICMCSHALIFITGGTIAIRLRNYNVSGVRALYTCSMASGQPCYMHSKCKITLLDVSLDVDYYYLMY